MHQDGKLDINKIKDIVATFLEISPNEISDKTLIGRDVIQSSAKIHRLRSELKKQGVHLVFTYGDPAFYSKVGFRQITEKTAKAPFILSQPEGWIAQSLLGEDIKPLPDQPYCVEAFNKPDLW